MHKLEWPLLFLAACLLLCSSLTQVKNEHVHSVGGIACSRLRASMTAITLRMLIVAHQTLRDVLNDSKFVSSLQLADDAEVLSWDDEGFAEELGAMCELPLEVAAGEEADVEDEVDAAASDS